MPNDVGVITEQGFVAGKGLGFSPIKEDLDKDPQKKENNEDKKENNK